MIIMEKWARSRYQPCLPLGENGTRVTGSKKHRELSRRAACEGTVLLKNNNRLLPIKRDAKIAVFGKAQIDYVKGGGGSGDVNTEYVRNINDGLVMKGVRVFEKLPAYYEQYCNEQYRKWRVRGDFDEAALPEELLREAAEYTDTAVITINRYSRENEDHTCDDSYFYLSAAEKTMVNNVLDNFENIIVLLNVGAMTDVTWFYDNDKIKAAVMLCQGGMEGGLAAADVLIGDANPSGKLVDTFAVCLEDYPSSEGFHESKDYVEYTEDIFVGYRYFETVPDMKKKVIYPFGYGMSYTEFKFSDVRACDNGKTVFVTADVTNTGEREGKETVQVYYKAPSDKLARPARELCAFEKTRNLAPGETQRIEMSFEIKDMSAFDDAGVIDKSSWVMEKGSYEIFVGNSVRDARKIQYEYVLDKDITVEKLHSYCAPEKLTKRLNDDGTYISVAPNKTGGMSFSCDYSLPQKPEEKLTLDNIADGSASLDELISQISENDLIDLTIGVPSIGVANTCGFGDKSEYGIPAFMTVDGPAGVRIEKNTGVLTTAFPVATMLACTWNTSLMEEIGRAGALEAKENNLQMWLTPALNIHRSPLCGRNFEYFSEDPFISGKMAAAKVRGIQSQGIAATPKHFAANNKETERFESDSIVSERALREIYLKGFEICIKESKPMAIMTSYNIINGIHSSENAELITGILRNEWGFDGMITTDWWNSANHVKEIQAGNDLRMPVGKPEIVKEALDKGEISIKQVAICVKHILELMLKLQ